MATENLSAEFQQKYVHTYLRISLDGGRSFRPAWINSNSLVQKNDSLDFQIELRFLDKNKYDVFMRKDVEIDFKFPRTGLINVKKDLLFMGRKSEKQFKKGPCWATVDAFPLHLQVLWKAAKYNRNLISSRPLSGADGDVDIFKNFFEPSYYSISQAIKKLKLENAEVFCSIGFAINHQWAIVLSDVDTYQFRLYRELCPVGFVNELSSREIEITIAPLYFQEFSDFLRRTRELNVKLKIYPN